MKHKTSELTEGRLNAAVAKALCVGDPVAAAKYSQPVVIRMGWTPPNPTNGS